MIKPEFVDLLDRYIAGKTSEDENQRLLNIYQHIVDRSDVSLDDEFLVEKIEERLINRFTESVKGKSCELNHYNKPADYFPRTYIKFFLVAASIFFFIGICLIYEKTIIKASLPTDIYKGTDLNNIVIYKNQTGGKFKLYFSDGSFAVVENGSEIVYERDLHGPQRKVYLKGKAFFQVTKDHARPFLVFTDQLMTKVLGTSFIVKSGSSNESASVTVITGKVAVFKKDELIKKNFAANLEDGLLLTPNHSVRLTMDQKLQKMIAANPSLIKNTHQLSFNFDNTPLSEVFERLEKAYNIKIVFDHKQLENCALSVDMGQEDFFQKLNLICNTLNLIYKTDNENIYVSGQGCTN